MSTADLDNKLARLRHGYETLMQEIMRRYDVIKSIVYDKKFNGYHITSCEIVGLNFRKIAELIVFANMIGHEQEYTTLHPKYEYEWRLKNIIQKIKAINPNYYPRAVAYKEFTLPTGEKGLSVENLPEVEWLTENELIDMYDYCGDLLHARNPFQDAIDLNKFDVRFKEWAPKLVMLLSQHQVYLVDGMHQISCIMSGTDNLTGAYAPDVQILELIGVDPRL